jgi:hypothetical protein
MTFPASVAEHRTKAVIAAVLFLLAVFAWEWVLVPTPSTTGSARTDQWFAGGHAEVRSRRRASIDLDPTLHLEALRLTETSRYAGSGRNLFEPVLAPPIIPGLTHHEFTFSKPAEVAAPFSTGLKFYGFSSNANSRRIFLLKGDDLFIAQEGDTIDRRYRIVRVTRDSVEIEDVLAGEGERIYLPHS